MVGLGGMLISYFIQFHASCSETSKKWGECVRTTIHCQETQRIVSRKTPINNLSKNINDEIKKIQESKRNIRKTLIIDLN